MCDKKPLIVQYVENVFRNISGYSVDEEPLLFSYFARGFMRGCEYEHERFRDELLSRMKERLTDL